MAGSVHKKAQDFEKADAAADVKQGISEGSAEDLKLDKYAVNDVKPEVSAKGVVHKTAVHYKPGK